jgi:hypothetical protein
MTTLCITGPQTQDFERVSDLLFNGGLEKAKPIERETTISLDDWHARVGPLLRKQQAPGRLWEQLAGDLLLANFQQPQWGWSDPATLDALEFWAELEPGMCFLLLTSDPQEYLAHNLLEGSGERGEEVDEKACLQEWRYQHERMLTFYLDNPERCLLVNARQARANPSAFVEKLEERWGVELDLSSTYFPVLAGNSRQEAPITLAQYIAEKSLVDHGKGLTPLREELHAAQFPLAEPAAQADPDGNILGSANLSLVSILRDYQQRCARDLSDSDRKALETLRRENEQLLTKLRYVQEQLDAKAETQLQLEQQLAEAKALPSVSPEELANLEEQRLAENEMLLLQLHQVQEELEASFIKQHESAEALAEREKALQSVSLDNEELRKARLQDEQQLDESIQQNEQLLGRLHEVQEELEASVVMLEGDAETLAEREKALQIANSENQQLREAREQAELELEEMRQTNEQLSLQVEQLGRVETQLQESTDHNEQLLLQLNQAQEELEHYFLLHQQAKDEVEKLTTENRKLELQKEMAQKQPEASPGLFGRLGSRKPVPSKPKLAYKAIQLKREQVNPDYEHLWITLRDVTFGEQYSPKWQFRLSCAGVKPNEFGEQPKLEIPEQTDQLLQNWFEESESEHGKKLELRFALPNAMDSKTWKQIDTGDQELISSLVEQLSELLNELKATGCHISRDWAEWQKLAADMKRIHKSKARK